jgi:hypothetical protein
LLETPLKQLKQSRNDLFASLDRPALKGLPSERYQYAEWKLMNPLIFK